MNYFISIIIMVLGLAGMFLCKSILIEPGASIGYAGIFCLALGLVFKIDQEEPL